MTLITVINSYSIFKLRTKMFIWSGTRPGFLNICLDISQVGVDQFSKISGHTFLR